MTSCILILSLLCTGCQVSGKKAYEKFNEAAKKTSELTSFEINKTKTVTQSGKTIITELHVIVLDNSDGNVALKEKTENGIKEVSYYKENFCYLEENNRKIKRGCTIQEFLSDLNQTPEIKMTEDTLSDLYFKGNRFELDAGGFASKNKMTSFHITGQVRSGYMKEISSLAEFPSDNQVSKIMITIKYTNPGKIPSYKFPENFDDYGF